MSNITDDMMTEREKRQLNALESCLRDICPRGPCEAVQVINLALIAIAHMGGKAQRAIYQMCRHMLSILPDTFEIDDEETRGDA